jgi:rhodanese-related sulfurtransferase
VRFTRREIEANRDYFAAKLRANRQLDDLRHKVKRDLATLPDFLLLDLRGRDPFALAHVPGALCVPMNELDQLSAQLPHDRELVTFCWSHY